MYCFTSINCNYIPRAIVMAKSLKKYNPDVKLCLVLCDGRPENLRESLELFDVIWTIQELGLPVKNLNMWIFKHTIRELCTAVKGWAVIKLFEELHADKVVYIDPDIAFFGSLDKISSQLDSYDIVLTPHITRPVESSHALDLEWGIIISGSFNLGFAAFRNTENGRAIANYWAQRLIDYCYDDYLNGNPERGIFVDQKWCTLLPIMFDNVCIDKYPGYNVARWNYHERHITRNESGDFLINGEPLIFYHFSYWKTQRMDGESHFNSWYDTQGQLDPNLRALVDWYSEENDKARKELNFCFNDKYCYNYYTNGESISNEARVFLRENVEIGARFSQSDPFDAAAKDCYYNWWRINSAPPVDQLIELPDKFNVFRATYHLLPFPKHIKQYLKNYVYSHYSRLFNNTNAYNAWLEQQEKGLEKKNFPN